MRGLLVLLMVCVWGGAAWAAPVCAKGVTDDTLRPLPAALAPAAARAFGLTMPPARVVQTTVARCMDGRVWACSQGANLPCGKANLSRGLPRAGRAWCRVNPSADYIPAYITGHDSVWPWSCVHGVPRPSGPAAAVDGRGFFVKYRKAVQ